MKHAPKVIQLGLALMLAGCGGAEEAPETAPEAEAPAMEAPVPDAMLDPNTATPEQLASVPGLDSAVVAGLVAGRPYADMVGVNAALPGSFDKSVRDQIYARLWLPLDLNTATEEEMLLIPGVGPNMAEEFEEYRPYDSIERFRREIGKYVDPAEVARLERYVTIR